MEIVRLWIIKNREVTGRGLRKGLFRLQRLFSFFHLWSLKWFSVALVKPATFKRIVIPDKSERWFNGQNQDFKQGKINLNSEKISKKVKKLIVTFIIWLHIPFYRKFFITFCSTFCLCYQMKYLWGSSMNNLSRKM